MKARIQVRASSRQVPASLDPAHRDYGYYSTRSTVELTVDGIMFVTDAPSPERALKLALDTAKALGVGTVDVPGVPLPEAPVVPSLTVQELAAAELAPACADCGYPKNAHPYRHPFRAWTPCPPGDG